MGIRTKIVCTMGPAVKGFEKICDLIRSGMSVARLNFAHGTHEEHAQVIRDIQRARKELDISVAIMADIKGPEIRVGQLPNNALHVESGLRLKLPEEIPMHPLEALHFMQVGMQLLFDDGSLISHIVEKSSDGISIEFQNSGILRSGKSINIPGANIPLPALTAKDLFDLKFSCSHGIEMVAASFIRSSHHVLSIKELLAKEGRPETLVISKIENQEGVEHFDQIVQVSDGIMIARGDLGVELDLALVPRLQKRMIRSSFLACKPSITATQMLESMIHSPRPTRAEVSDVANAIYDCTSAIMLSGETAVGKYPLETVRRMRSIAEEAEGDFDYRQFFEKHSERGYHDVSSAVVLAAVKTAYSANAKAIFAFTSSGMTARLLSRLMPKMPIVALTANPVTYQQLALYWGVIPVYTEKCSNVQEAFSITSKFALEKGIIEFGDLVVVTSGAPFGKRGSTNMMRVESIGEILVRGHHGFGQHTSAPIHFLFSLEGKDPQIARGKFVVISHCDDAFYPFLKESAGLILQNSIADAASERYAVTVAKSLGIPVITRADGAMAVLTEGSIVTLDPQKGLVYSSG